MKVSRNWLQTFFDTPLPEVPALAEALTFHSSEIEETIEAGNDTVLDVKVLPDKSSWLLSHRGVAKEVSTILDLPMKDDPLRAVPALTPVAAQLAVTVDTKKCARYAGAVVRGVGVKQSPPWLRERLEAIGQRSINNVVDATNYVMFHLGQPLHAFDAGKLASEEGKYHIGVRQANAGETIVALTGEEYALTPDDVLIVDYATNAPIGIAGVKGGMPAAIGEETTDIIIESANFDRVFVRKTSQRLKLRTDASARYENGVVPELAGYGLTMVVDLIREIAGGTLEGYVDVFPSPRTITPVSVSLEKINSVLGLSLSEEEVLTTIKRFGYEVAMTGGILTLTPPVERDDLVIPEDLIEEIGRMYGLHHIPSVAPEPVPLAEYNKRFYYADCVRETLVNCGFSEVFTSSFRKKDEVHLANALAEDKTYLRSTLRENLNEALARNVLNKDLLALSHVAIFEIGAVFSEKGEHVSLAFGVRTGAAYSAKTDDPLVEAAIKKIEEALGAKTDFSIRDGIAEIDFDTLIMSLPAPTVYTPYTKRPDVTYAPFSPYPFISRDIALWVAEGTSAEAVESVLREQAGDLLVRLSLFDEFKKDNRISYAFRLVFQSMDRTLTNDEINTVMDRVTASVTAKNWEVR